MAGLLALLLAILVAPLHGDDTSAWEVTLASGASHRSALRIVNRCGEPHTFNLKAEEASFLDIPRSANAVLVAPAKGEMVAVVFDATGLQPGLYRGQLLILCEDCQGEPGCGQDRDTVPVTLRVTDLLEFSGVTERDGRLVFESPESFYETLTKLERLESKRSATATPVLDAFEARFHFTSLRRSIYGAQERLLRAGEFDEITDPTNYFIQDDYLLSVLNDNAEFQIADSIFMLWDQHLAIEVQEASTDLDQIRRFGPAANYESEVTYHPLTSGKLAGTCTANFGVQATASDTQVQFVNQSSGKEPFLFLWDFGDGTTSEEKEPLHEFPATGGYRVCLTLLDADGCSDSRCHAVEPGGTCSASFLAQGDGATVQFTNTSSGSPEQYHWDFGDGKTSTEASPSHTYSTFGDHFVCLRIVTSDLCTSQRCEFVSPSSDTDCCDANDRVRHEWTCYGDGKGKFKSTLWQTNLPYGLYHRWGSKTVNYERDDEGRWHERAADKISALGGGTIVFRDSEGKACRTPRATDASEPLSGESRAHAVRAVGQKFWTKQDTLGSVHYVVFDGQTIYGPTLRLSNDCPRPGECRRECRKGKRECKKVCRETKQNCKKDCREAKKSCKSDCSGLKGKAKRKCKKNCRQQKRTCKKGCRTTKSECKDVCQEGKRTCVRKTCRGIPSSTAC